MICKMGGGIYKWNGVNDEQKEPKQIFHRTTMIMGHPLLSPINWSLSSRGPKTTNKFLKIYKRLMQLQF